MTVSAYDNKKGEFQIQDTGNKKSLQILFVVGAFPVLPETFIINQITGLIDRGHKVDIFSYYPGKTSKIHHDVLDYKLLDHTYYRVPPKKLDAYDIILCQFGPLGSHFVKLKKEKKFKAKIITCFRGYDISQYIKIKGPHVYKRLFKDGDLFLPVCNYFKEKLIKLGCDPQKILVHHSAIDPSRFKFKSKISNHTDSAHIVSVNRLVPKKGTEYAINAFAQLAKKYPKLKYHIVGGGHLKNKLQALIRRHRLEKQIKLLGWGTQKDVVAELSKADLFILPSVTASDGNEEGIPNALKEPMSMGIPVIGTYHAGIAELIEHGVSGYLVAQRDVNRLAEKMEQLIIDPDKRKKMGIAGRKKIEDEYDVEKLNDRLVDIFYTVLAS